MPFHPAPTNDCGVNSPNKEAPNGVAARTHGLSGEKTNEHTNASFPWAREPLRGRIEIDPAPRLAATR
jgi:hypothetical protein